MEDQNQQNSDTAQPDSSLHPITGQPKRTFLRPSTDAVTELAQIDPLAPQAEAPVATNPQQPNTPQEAQDQQQPPKPPSANQKAVLQPSAELVQAVKAAQDRAAMAPSQTQTAAHSTPSQDTQASVTQAVSEQATTAAPATATAQTPKPDPNSIYPDATKTISTNAAGRPVQSLDNIVPYVPKAPSFDQGYQIGGTIFWYQFFAGLVLELIAFVVSKITHASLVSDIESVVGYLVTLYMAYRVLKDDGTEDALWVTPFGGAIQLVIVAVAFALLNMIIFSVISHATFLFTGLPGSLILLIVFLMVTYWLTKLSWGITFAFLVRLNKVAIRAIGVTLTVLLIGVGVYRYALPQITRTNTPATTSAATSIQSVGLSTYHVTGDPAFTVNFYSGSKTYGGDGGAGNVTYSTSHVGQETSISVSNGAEELITSCAPTGTDSQFTFHIQGSPGIVCVTNNKTLTQYAGYIQVKGSNYVINMFSFSYQQKLGTVKRIFNSLVIN